MHCSSEASNVDMIQSRYTSGRVLWYQNAQKTIDQKRTGSPPLSDNYEKDVGQLIIGVKNPVYRKRGHLGNLFLSFFFLLVLYVHGNHMAY